jgi:hypothetical protein
MNKSILPRIATTSLLQTLAFAIPLLVALPSHAEIYKWVDANGRTHYSETKPTSTVNKLKEVVIRTTPVTSSTSRPSRIEVATNATNATSNAATRQAFEKTYQERATHQETVAESGTLSSTNRPLLSHAPNTVETDAIRCARARDLLPRIKAGAVKHLLWNGAVTNVDDNDRIIAENDIANFCR